MPAPKRPRRPVGSSQDLDVAVTARGQAAAMAVAPGAALEPPGRGDLARVTLADGASTAVYVAAFAAVSTELRVAVLRRPERLATWCAGARHRRRDRRRLLRPARRGAAGRGAHARRDTAPRRLHTALGRAAGVRARGGRRRPDRPPRRAAGAAARRPPPGRAAARARRRAVLRARARPGGLPAGQAQFDSDITDGRYPRAALGTRPAASSRSCATGARRTMWA